MTDDAETLDSPEPSSVVEYWKSQIEREKELHKDFRDLAKDAQEAYEKDCTFNIMWPTVEITSSALYSATPDPEVRRRQRDGDDIQKRAADAVERAIDFCVDTHDFDGNVRQGIDDMLIAGLGTARIKYIPKFGKTVDEIGQEIEFIKAQAIAVEHISWKHFHWQPCKSWEKCEWVAFQHQMSKKEVRQKYNVEASEEADPEEVDGKARKVPVYEIYHKPSKSITVIAEQFDEPLEIRKDDLGLEGFFPCPEPMMTNVQTDKLIPGADFKYYSNQYAELDKVAKRISTILTGSKAVSFYDAHFRELSKYRTAKDGDLIPLDNMMEKLGDSSLNNVLAEYPLGANANALGMVVEYKKHLISEVYEILGISDIMRGETNAMEGVETQVLKSEFGANRIREKQGSVNRFCRDLFRIMGEVISEHFTPPVLQKVTGIEIDEEVAQTLSDDFLRNVSIDIETDSTSAGDKIRHKKERMEGMETLLGGLGQILPGMMEGVIPKSIGQELLLMVVRSVDAQTGNLEDVIARMGDESSPEVMLAELQQQMMQMQQELEQAQQELQKHSEAETFKKQASGQRDLMEAKKTEAEIPLVVAETQQTHVETDGKRVEQAANIVTGMEQREPFLRGIE